MTSLPAPPPEVASDRDVMKLAPVFAAKVFDVLQQMERLGHDPMISEGFRSDERQRFLYGFGREYDDGRGVVTNASDGRSSWHRYGLAVDIISKSKEWDAPPTFWNDLRECAQAIGLTPGAVWKHPDRPHVQHHCPGMPVSPTADDWALLESGGFDAVWRKYLAVYLPEAA